MKKTYIVSRYNDYEWINTERNYCKFFIVIKYYFKGYRVWDYPLWLAKLVFKLTGKRIYGLNRQNLYVEKHIKGSDQVTFYMPYNYS